MAKRTPTGSAGRTLAWLAALLVVLAAILAVLVTVYLKLFGRSEEVA